MSNTSISLKHFVISPLALCLIFAKWVHRVLILNRRGLIIPSVPILVVGSPQISGAGRTSITILLVKSAIEQGYSREKIAVLCFDIFRDGTWTDDMKLLKETGASVHLVENRGEFIQNHPEYDVFLCDGGWEDPALDKCFRILLLGASHQDHFTQLWPWGNLRSLLRERPKANLRLQWSKDLRFLPSNPVNFSHKPWDPKSPSVLLLSCGNQKGLLEELDARGFFFDEILSLRDHSRQVESKLLFLLDKYPDHQILITHKERVKCSPETLHCPRIFILSDTLVGLPTSEIWSQFP